MSSDIDKELIDTITCPITHCVFLKPIVAEDGHTYEEFPFLEWHKIHNTSPITRKDISATVVPNYAVISIIDTLVKIKPYIKDLVYKRDMSHKKNKEDITKFINERQFDKLLNYTSFDLNDMDIVAIFQNCKDNATIYHILKNSNDITNFKHGNWNLINLASRYNNFIVLTYGVNENIDMYNLINGWNNLQLACINASFEIINYLIDFFNVSERMIGKHNYFDLIDKNNIITNTEKNILKSNIVDRIKRVAIEEYKRSISTV